MTARASGQSKPRTLSSARLTCVIDPQKMISLSRTTVYNPSTPSSSASREGQHADLRAQQHMCYASGYRNPKRRTEADAPAKPPDATQRDAHGDVARRKTQRDVERRRAMRDGTKSSMEL